MSETSMPESPESATPLLLIVITGPVGAGKTTTADALYEQLAAANIPVARIDMDGLRWASPELSYFNNEIGYANLRSMIANYRAMGIGTFVLADVVETQEQRNRYLESAPGSEVHIVRLRVPPDVVEARLRNRESGESLGWYLLRAPELEAIFTANQIGDIVIECGERPATAIAAEIVTRLQLASIVARS